jgi:hypothetical protein
VTRQQAVFSGKRTEGFDASDMAPFLLTTDPSEEGAYEDQDSHVVERDDSFHWLQHGAHHVLERDNRPNQLYGRVRSRDGQQLHRGCG